MQPRIPRFILIGIWVIGCCFTHNGMTENARIIQTKDKLKQLNKQIEQLQQTLAHSQDKRGTLNQELGNTEKQIGNCVQKIKVIEQGISLKQQNIVVLQQRVKALSNDLSQQQTLLAQHVRARYKMGEYRPIIIALNQNDPYKLNQLLTYYHYLVRSRQTIIDDIKQTQKNIAVDQEKLQQEVKSQQGLQAQLHDQRHDLENTKNYHQLLIKSLTQDIQTQQHTLTEYKQNKENLSRLLQNLARESEVITHPSQPFVSMRHKLPLPVKVSANAMQRMNQGAMFFAAEGTPVHAVYPGQVVFSDWLRGYGLLLIIDHGQGFMTLYAHNQSLFKAKGTKVAQGEQISTIGHSGGLKQNGLYFEVRQRGKAVPPSQWLK